MGDDVLAVLVLIQYDLVVLTSFELINGN